MGYVFMKKNILNAYNEMHNCEKTGFELRKEIKESGKKPFTNTLLSYLDRYVEDSFNEIKKLENNVPFSLIEKYNRIKALPHKKMFLLEFKVSRYEKFSLELLRYIDGIKISKLVGQLNKLKTKTKDSNILELIHKEMMNVNNLKPGLLKDTELYTIQLNIKKIERKISNINNSKVVNFPDKNNQPASKNNSASVNTNKPVNNIIVDTDKYKPYLKNPLLYFDVVKFDIATQQLDENVEKEMFKYIDGLKEEFKYLFTTTLDSKDDNKVIKMLMSLDSLVGKKLENYEQQYARKVS